jgi:glycosyltransferase involved in cell wall biosynthesis
LTRPLRIVSVMEASTVTGVAKALLAFYKTARSRGWADVSLITFVRTRAGQEAPSNSFIEAIRSLNFAIDVIPESGAVDLAAWRRLRSIIAAEAPDVIETHAVKSHVLMRFERRNIAKWVAFHHGYTTQDLKMRLYNRLNPWALRGADRIITVCGPFRDQLAAAGVPRDRISVIGNAIEASTLPLSAAPKNTRTAVAIGRLSAEKGHRYLLSAMAHLRRAHPELDARLVLVGDGPERGNLEKQAAELGLREHVRFAGHQTDPQPFYAQANVFVLPSLSEGSPLVLLEAMLARIPIVATTVGGIPETVTQEHSALLVPPEQPVALADAMSRVLTDEALASGLRRNAYAAVTSRHTPEAYCDTLLGIYNGLLG